MNVYLSRAFTRLAAREGLTNVHICQAVAEMKVLKPSEIKTALQCGELNEVNYNEKET